MATGAVLPADRLIYRAITSKSQVHADGSIDFQRLFLKPAHGTWPDEDYLSFGISPDGAREGLTTVYTVAEISVAEILALPYGLDVRTDPDNIKVRVYGVPLRRDDESKAVAIAKDLGRKLRAHPP